MNGYFISSVTSSSSFYFAFIFIFDALNLDSESPFKKASMNHQATRFPAKGLCWEGQVRKVLLKGVFMYVNCTMYCY